jgi:fluoroacetyl-CoA thioesterase
VKYSTKYNNDYVAQRADFRGPEDRSSPRTNVQPLPTPPPPPAASLPRSRRVYRMRHEVTATDTAAAMGSGDVPVLATPRLIAWMEAATVRAATAFLGKGQTTVGTAIRIEHRRATPVRGSVEINATPPKDVAGSRLTFHVQAVDGSGEVIAAGEIDRAIVDRQRFLDSVSATDAGH